MRTLWTHDNFELFRDTSGDICLRCTDSEGYSAGHINLSDSEAILDSLRSALAEGSTCGRTVCAIEGKPIPPSECVLYRGHLGTCKPGRVKK